MSDVTEGCSNRPKTTKAVAAPPHERAFKMCIARMLMDFRAGPERAISMGRRKVKQNENEIAGDDALGGRNHDVRADPLLSGRECRRSWRGFLPVSTSS